MHKLFYLNKKTPTPIPTAIATKIRITIMMITHEGTGIKNDAGDK